MCAVAAQNIGPLEHAFLGQEGLFVGVVGPGTMFAAAQYLVLIRYLELVLQSIVVLD